MIDDLREELDLLNAVYEAARDVRDEWLIRGDHMVERRIEDLLKMAVSDLEACSERHAFMDNRRVLNPVMPTPRPRTPQTER